MVAYWLEYLLKGRGSILVRISVERAWGVVAYWLEYLLKGWCILVRISVEGAW